MFYSVMPPVCQRDREGGPGRRQEPSPQKQVVAWPRRRSDGLPGELPRRPPARNSLALLTPQTSGMLKQGKVTRAPGRKPPVTRRGGRRGRKKLIIRAPFTDPCATTLKALSLGLAFPGERKLGRQAGLPNQQRKGNSKSLGTQQAAPAGGRPAPDSRPGQRHLRLPFPPSFLSFPLISQTEYGDQALPINSPCFLPPFNF